MSNYEDVYAPDLTEETESTLSGSEQFVMFDSVEGKRAELSTIADYIVANGEIDGSDIPTIVSTIEGNIGTLDTKVGDLTDLDTTDKTDIVSAVNEVNGKAEDADAKADTVDEHVGDLSELETEDKTSAVDAINEAVGDIGDLKEDLSTKADVDGVYPDLSAGNITGDFHIDTAPYLFRQTAGGADHIGGKAFDTLVGGSVAWNQLLDIETMGAFIASTKSYDSSTGVVTVTPTNYGSNSIGFYTTAAQLRTKTNHVYFTSVDVNPDYSGLFRFGIEGSAKSERLNAGSYQTLATIAKRNGEYAVTLYLASQDWTTGVYKYKNGIVIDLTQMFGTTIADYIYSLEQATAGAGVAWFKSYGYIRDGYIPYNAGTLQSVKTTAHVTRDADDTIIGNYPLDDIELRGVAKLVNNEIKYDGDVYEADGTVTRKYASVDMGTLAYDYNGVRFAAILSGVSLKADRMKGVSNKYITFNGAVSGAPDKAIIFGGNNDNNIYIKDSAYTDPAAFKTAMSGVYLIYEKATPTTETTDPFTSPQQVFADGTEEYIDNRTVPIPVGHETKYELDLAEKLIGLPWDLSMLAPIENGTTASQAYAQGKYFVRNNEFCKAKTAIASGATFTLGTNYEVTTVGAEIFALA